MIELSIEDMKNIGLNLGQRKKLIKYIEFIKTIKNEKKDEIVINENSTEEEVAKFLNEKMNFSDKTIKELQLDGTSLFLLTQEEIEGLEELNQNEKEKLIHFVNHKEKIENKQNEDENKIEKIDDNNNKISDLREDINEKKENKNEIKKEDKIKNEEHEIKNYNRINNIIQLYPDEIEIEKQQKNETNNYYNINTSIKTIKNDNKNDQDISESINNKKNIKNDNTNHKDINNILNNIKENNNLSNKENNKLRKRNKSLNYNRRVNQTGIKENFKDDGENVERIISDEVFSINDDFKEEMNKTIIKKEYQGKKINYINYHSIKNYRIQSIIKDSKYNIFFLLIIYDKYINHLSLSTYVYISSFFGFSYIIIDYPHYFINEQNIIKKNEKVKYIMVQVPIKKDTRKLSISFCIDYYYRNSKFYDTQIDIKNGIENYFFINNLNYCENYNLYYYNYYNYYFFPTLNDNDLFAYFLIYFFDKEKNNDECLQKSLIKALNSKIYNLKEIELNPENIIKFFKFCYDFKIEVKNINAIKLIGKKNYLVPKEYYLSNEDINNFIVSKKEKPKLINLIVKIYANYNKKFLMELIQSKNGNLYSRSVLDLLNEKKLKFNDLFFNNKENLIQFQYNLLTVSENKKEINYVIKISKKLTNCLKFICENYNIICSILEKDSRFYRGDEKNYLLTLSDLENDEQIDNINEVLIKIFDTKDYRIFKILNFQKIFEDLYYLYLNKPLNELCKLYKIENIFKKQNIRISNIENFYKSIHEKGIQLIKEKKMNINEIINFIYNQDIYYYDSNYKNDTLRDPKIFSYISITDSYKNNRINIEILKKYKIWDLFSESKYNIKKQFYESFLCQIEKFKDLKYIFELFSFENISKDFIDLIKEKANKIIYTILDEKEDQYEILFEILKNLVICNYKNNNLDFYFPILNYNFTSKYIFYLLKDKKIEYIINNNQHIIIDFFLNQIIEGNTNEESLISLLLLSPNNDFCLDLLNKMGNMIMKENDFYQKEENKKYILFKIFFEKCKNLFQNEKINNGKFLYESLLIKNKILNDLSQLNIKFEVIDNLIDESNIFYNKILTVYDGNKEKSIMIYNKIKNELQNCTNKLSKFEKIEDYYTTFFSVSKKKIISLIKKNLNNLKQKNINELSLLDENEIIKNKEFNLEISIKESENIKYKNSLFFMSIYKEIFNNENSEKSELEILNEAIKSFKESLTRIIQQNETKESFYEINNVKEIMKVIKNRKENNLKDEINFIKNEFLNLEKGKYIQNNLLDDLINFSNKNKIEKLIQGIIYFINSYSKICFIKKTEFINNLEKKYNILNSKQVSGGEIKEIIGALEQLNYDINKETSLIKFYNIFLGKEDSVLFLKKIKDSNLEIRNLNEFIDENENSQLQTTDIDNLLDIYTFFLKFLENDKVKTDEDFHNIFRNEFENYKNIIIKLQDYLSTYGEIIQIYELYHENPEITIQKVFNLLKNSNVEIYQEEKEDTFNFKIKYFNQENKLIEINLNEIKELKNKLLISSTNTNLLKENIKSKENLTNQFVTLIDNIKQLTNTLNSLLKSGYPNIINLELVIENSVAYKKNNRKENLEIIIEEYENINKLYKKTMKKGYLLFPILRLFHGKQFIKLNDKLKNKDINISHLVNSMTLNMIKNFNISYQYNNNINNIENINKFLEILFNKNQVNIEKIYNINKILNGFYLTPGLYRKVKIGDNSVLINNILNIYLNLTGNAPIINTLLICNEETNSEKVISFLYRAIFCGSPILFLIANMEYLELSVIQKIIKTFKKLYEFKKKNIKSYLLFMYEKVDSGFSRDLEKIIPEKNILNDYFFKKSTKSIDIFNKTELYSSKFAGYGKTTEIIYKVKNKKCKYYYLPIGGSFTRNYVINNLENLDLKLENGKESYLHIDLSEADNDNLMNEILFKLLILRFLDSNEKIYYL